MTVMLRMLMIVVLMAMPQPGFAAIQPDEILGDPLLETRARAISRDLRCMVCQNQSIDDSDADLARDLRLLVRERLVAGDSDRDVIDYVVARYGEFVLLRPVMAVHTLVLWIAAPVILLIGMVFLVIGMRRRRAYREPTPQLTAEERRVLDKLAKS